jgi:putative ABC transport system ATP-binding protein
VILADEPTGNLDSENTLVVVELLRKLAHEQGYCVITVTHDLAIADMADEVLRLKDGALVDDKS